MSKKILFQSLLKFRDQIKDGTAKVQDIITDYFNQTGKSVTEEERAIILNEFAKDAPSNIEEVLFTDKKRGPNVQKAGEMSDTPFTDKVKKDQGIDSLRGDESFSEILEKLGPSKEEGIGSMIPKEYFGYNRGKGGEFTKIPSPVYMDDIRAADLPLDKSRIKNQSQRDEFAEFIRKMRGEKFENPTIRKIVKDSGGDIEGGKRAATILARAADMKADTKVKQELLSELDEMKMDKGPRFFQEEFMGYDDFRSAEDAKKIEVNNAIVDDLEAMGVADEDVMRIMGRAREINRKPFYTSGEDFVDIIKDELEFQGIDYDVEFYKNYFRELTGLMRKPEPRFMYGGVV